jgi:hypothetical protein
MVLRARVPRAATIIAAGLLWGILFFAAGTCVTGDAGIICVVGAPFYGVSLVAGVVQLLKRNFLTGACWIAVSSSIWLPIHALNALHELSGDGFAASRHREIADIYRRRQSEHQSEFVFDQTKLSGMGPHLVSFDIQCHPRDECECWVVWDPRHVSGIEGDIGRSHKPASSIFPHETFYPQFSRVDVRRIDADAYSVLACPSYANIWLGWPINDLDVQIARAERRASPDSGLFRRKLP